MKTFTYTIKDAIGMHARPAGMLAKLTKSFPGTKIVLHYKDKSVEVNRLLKIMGLGIKCGDTVTITAEGREEAAAIEEVERFMNEHL